MIDRAAERVAVWVDDHFPAVLLGILVITLVAVILTMIFS